MNTKEKEPVPFHTYNGNPPTQTKEVAIITTGYGSRLHVDLLRWNDSNPTYVLSIRKHVRGKGENEKHLYFPVKGGIMIAEETIDSLRVALDAASTFIKAEGKESKQGIAGADTNTRTLLGTPAVTLDTPVINPTLSPDFSSRVIACGGSDTPTTPLIGPKTINCGTSTVTGFQCNVASLPPVVSSTVPPEPTDIAKEESILDRLKHTNSGLPL
jgi:hypothetical protein